MKLIKHILVAGILVSAVFVTGCSNNSSPPVIKKRMPLDKNGDGTVSPGEVGTPIPNHPGYWEGANGDLQYHPQSVGL